MKLLRELNLFSACFDMLANKQFSEVEGTHLSVDFALRVNNFRCIINLHINVALPRRGDQLRICSPVCVLNQQTANYVCVFSTETVFAG